MKTTIAYLIHRINWRDSSAIGHFLTSEGMVSVILRGVRRSKSPLAPGLRPFARLQMTLVGRGDLKIARSLECLSMPAVMDYRQQACGLYINELIHSLITDEGKAIFDAYSQLIRDLPSLHGNRMEWALRHFERKILACSGYAISVPDSVSDNAWCHYVDDTGLQLDSNVSTIVRKQLSAKEWRRFLQGERLDNNLLPALKYTMRQCIHHAMGGKKLYSRELLKPLSSTTGRFIGKNRQN